MKNTLFFLRACANYARACAENTNGNNAHAYKKQQKNYINRENNRPPFFDNFSFRARSSGEHTHAHYYIVTMFHLPIFFFFILALLCSPYMKAPRARERESLWQVFVERGAAWKTALHFNCPPPPTPPRVILSLWVVERSLTMDGWAPWCVCVH